MLGLAIAPYGFSGEWFRCLPIEAIGGGISLEKKEKHDVKTIISIF